MELPTVITGLLLLLATALPCLGQHDVESATVTSFEGFGELPNVISTRRTNANLSCESGDMVVKLQFADRFRGVIYADRDRNSPCKTYGDGNTFYVFPIPLQGCGTKERVTSEYRMFVNDIVVRFHPSLELEGDEVKTILCRYPPPVAPLPPVIVPPPLPPEPAVIAAGPRRLSEVELMLIICAILFLGLLLLGIGLAYYCLKKRNIKIVKRRVLSSGAPSEITKLSGSTLGPLSMPFDGIRIPRATAHSTSGSEAALLTSAGEHSDTLPSDYPSESPSSLHSELEEVETITRHVSAYENQAFTREEYSREQQAVVVVPPPPPPQPRPRESRSLTTIHEQEDFLQREEFRRVHALVTQQQHEAAPPPPRFAAEPPVYARIRKRQMEQTREESSHTMTEEDYMHHHSYAPASIPDSEMTPQFTESQAARSMSEYLEESHMTQYAEYHDETDGRTSRSMSEYTEPPPVAPPEPPVVKAAPARHIMEDNYLTTVTETHTSEDTERVMRDYTEMHIKAVPPPPPPPPPKWDVLIRTFPPNQPEDSGETSSDVDTWDRFSVVSERPRVLFESVEDTLTTMEVQPSEPVAPTNWDVLIRVLEPPPPATIPDSSDDVRSILSEDDRDKWKAILTTDSTLRTLLTEARTTEEFEMIRRDERYEKLFEAPKWDVIIRILAVPPELPSDAFSDSASVSDTASYTSERPSMRYRRKSDWEVRSRRNSLPPLYEQDDPLRLPTTDYGPSRRSSITTDLERESLYSEDVAGIGGSDIDDVPLRPRLHRPSLLRSTSEVLHGLETIERDSLDGRSSGDDEFRAARGTSGKVLFQRFPHNSPSPSPSSSPTAEERGRHRFLERSSTEMTVNNQTRHSLNETRHSLNETRHSQEHSSHMEHKEVHSYSGTSMGDHWRH